MRRAILCLLFAGCGKAASSYRDFVHQTNTAFCEAVTRCCPAPGSVSSCTASADAVAEHNTVQVEAQVASGSFTFHGDVASLCIDAIRGALSNCTASSTNLSSNAKLCSGVLTGGDGGVTPTSRIDQPEGASCDTALECAGGVCQGGTCQLPSTIAQEVCGSG